MNNQQLASVLVSPTGTGRLYSAYAQGPDEAVWTYNASGLVSKLRMTRVRPIPTPSFGGVDRLSQKLTETFIGASGAPNRIVVTEIITSAPVDVTEAERAEVAANFLLSMQTTGAWWTAFTTGRIPT